MQNFLALNIFPTTNPLSIMTAFQGVELLLAHEERVWQPGTPHSWEAIDPVSATYTPDITPLTLATCPQHSDPLSSPWLSFLRRYYSPFTFFIKSKFNSGKI